MAETLDINQPKQESSLQINNFEALANNLTPGIYSSADLRKIFSLEKDFNLKFLFNKLIKFGFIMREMVDERLAISMSEDLLYRRGQNKITANSEQQATSFSKNQVWFVVSYANSIFQSGPFTIEDLWGKIEKNISNKIKSIKDLESLFGILVTDGILEKNEAGYTPSQNWYLKYKDKWDTQKGKEENGSDFSPEKISLTEKWNFVDCLYKYYGSNKAFSVYDENIIYAKRILELTRNDQTTFLLESLVDDGILIKDISQEWKWQGQTITKYKIIEDWNTKWNEKSKRLIEYKDLHKSYEEFQDRWFTYMDYGGRAIYGLSQSENQRNIEKLNSLAEYGILDIDTSKTSEDENKVIYYRFTDDWEEKWCKKWDINYVH